jgi:Nidogen-like
MFLDTGNGGTDQNQIWLRVGNETSDLLLARDIIAGNGTLFNPQVVMVATWYKVEAYYQRAFPKNTFQLIMAYSETGATFGIPAYTQLQFFQSDNGNVATVEYINDFGVPFLSIATVNSNTTMNQLQNGTNCNRTGIYVYRINAGSTKAPTKCPTKVPTKSPTVAPAPTKCGLLGWSIYCPRTRCGWMGRWFGLCHTLD